MSWSIASQIHNFHVDDFQAVSTWNWENSPIVGYSFTGSNKTTKLDKSMIYSTSLRKDVVTKSSNRARCSCINCTAVCPICVDFSKGGIPELSTRKKPSKHKRNQL